MCEVVAQIEALLSHTARTVQLRCSTVDMQTNRRGYSRVVEVLVERSLDFVVVKSQSEMPDDEVFPFFRETICVYA